MRRRKLLIGLGALSAGGSAAFGTEAFTSAQAERNVDVAVAGDRSSFIAIQPLSSNNAGTYVDTESDNTVEIELDGDRGSGEGVAQDAITQLEDLFRVVNQGSQEVSVYFEDDSDAVTFRVTRSTGTSTTGSNGQSLEGADNSVELAVGEQVVVGMTVDTLNNDVSGQLLDRATLYADANASAPQQSIPEPQYIVDGDGDDPNTFEDLSSALGQASSGSVIGVEEAATVTESGSVTVATDDVTITGINGTPTIQTPDLSGGINFIEIGSETSGVTVRNLKLEPDNAGGDFPTVLAAKGSDAVLDGIVFDGDQNDPQGNAPITVSGENPTVKNLEVIGGVISAGGTGTVTLRNNYINGALTEGVFATSSADFIVENNRVDNHNDQGSNSKEIKLTSPSSVNGETDTAAQIESLLTENSVNSVQVSGDAGTRATPDIVGSGEQFGSVSEVVKPGVQGSPGGSALVALFEDGTYRLEDTVEFPQNAIVANASSGSRPTVEYRGGSGSGNVRFDSGATMEGLRIEIRGGSSGNKISGGAPVFEAIGGGVEFRDLEMEAFQSELDAPVGSYLNINDSSGSNAVVIEDNVFQASNGTPVATGHADSSGGGAIIRNNQYEDGASLAGSFGSGDDLTINDNTVADPSGAEAFFTFPAEADAGDLEMNNNDFATPSSSEEAIKLLEVPATVNGQTPSSSGSTSKAQNAAEILANANPGAVPVEVQDGDGSNGLAE